jgi:hypothetical protein
VAFSGRISVLVSTELQILLSAIRELPKEVAAQNRKHTRAEAEPIWQDEVRGQVVDRQQTRVLSDTARVAVTDSNVLLRSGGIGKTHGTPNSVIAKGTEFGADHNFTRTVTNRKGTSFKRHTKRQFNLPRARGYVVYPAALLVIPRLVSLWVQTTVRTIHEQFEKGGAR